MKQIRIINITLCLVAIVAAWFSPAQMDSKVFVTFFFTVVILFWVAARGKRLFGNYKFLG
jgi:hypothetical protein